MPKTLDREKVRDHLEKFDLRSLFIEELGWDHGGEDTEPVVGGHTFSLKAIAHKRGMVAYRYIGDSNETFPDYPTRQKIEKAVAKSVREHIIVYAPPDRTVQYWQWVKREPGRPDRSRLHIYHRGQHGEGLIQRLERLVFTLDEEDDLTIVDVSGRVRAAFDVERVTRRFYDRFKTENDAFLGFILGIQTLADREWYASLMLNRMMFIYFIQKRGFLDGDLDYLRNRLERMQREQGGDKFYGFYHLFLLKLFHDGLGKPEADRAPELVDLLGKVPYLNGGLFDVHDLERDNLEIHIPDEAFQRIFSFFDTYQWQLDDRPLHKDNEINPDVLGYIFEKYINQKQLGAYYTKEDITGYISRNTVIPFLFDQARKECAPAFKPDGRIWRLLRDNPDRYFHDAVRHGITYDIHRKQDLEEKRDLPPEIEAGVTDVSKRESWNDPVPPDCGLPTETWREHVARRKHYDEVCAKLVAGDVVSIIDLVTYNLDIEKFAQDVIAQSEGPELVRAFWRAINTASILDPTCGSGAFLFAALNILEPLYVTCLGAMRGFLDDLGRSGRKHHPETMNDFRKILERVTVHANERYFILKSIVVGNLYGVDIMEEAVEICKLRLFLKLVAQLDSYDQIEPLPDIDFNIRPGNTLVGFSSLDQVKRALGDDMIKQLALPDIEDRAGKADRAFQKFREMQTEHGMNATAVSNEKVNLRQRLGDLRVELNRYLATEHGIKTRDEAAYSGWKDRHQPFHWFVEFYGIMHGGGFDVIVGNPPYVELKALKQYKVLGYASRSAGNLYALVMERCLEITPERAYLGFIVPVSSISADRYAPLQRLVQRRNVHYSSYDDRPARLFDGLEHVRLTIHLLSPQIERCELFSTQYHKWTAPERMHLLQVLSYTRTPNLIEMASMPKLRSEHESSILSKLLRKGAQLSDFISGSHSASIFYSRKVGYFLQVLDFVPLVRDGNGNRRAPSEFKEIKFENPPLAAAALCCLNSNLFYWFVTLFSDCRHVNKREINHFPIDLDVLSEGTSGTRLTDLASSLMDSIRSTSDVKNLRFKHDSLTVQCVFPKYSKSIIDDIDGTLGEHFNFTQNEVDFIVNYDIKYRVGLDDLTVVNDP